MEEREYSFSSALYLRSQRRFAFPPREQRNSAFTARAVGEVLRRRGFCRRGSRCLTPLQKLDLELSTLSEWLLGASSSSGGRNFVQWTSVEALKNSRRAFSVSAEMNAVEKSGPSSDRCAIITGVARKTAIGRTLVHQFLKNGYKVVGADIMELENGGEGLAALDSFHFVRGDISDPIQAKHIVDETVQKFGGCIHVLINNAGKTSHLLSGENRIRDFTDMVAVNLNAAYYMSQFALPYMPAGQSSIIHIASTRALQSEPNSEGYAASKAGLCGLTHAQAITLSGKVRVNVVLPGWINTDPSGGAALRLQDHEWHPAGRVGVPHDVAHMCLFLCDSERAGFITGQKFVVDGGVTKKMVYPED